MFVEALVAIDITQDIPIDLPTGPDEQIGDGPLPFSDQAIYQDDPVQPGDFAPELTSYSIRAGTQFRSSNASGGRVTFTLTAPLE